MRREDDPVSDAIGSSPRPECLSRRSLIARTVKSTKNACPPQFVAKPRGARSGQTKSDGLRVDEARRAMRRFFVGLATGLTGCLTERPTAQTVTALGMDRVNK
jgi:hypothetical protein